LQLIILDWKVEAVLNKRYDVYETEYLIKWVGFDEPTWEQKSNLNCLKLLKDWKSQEQILVIVKDFQKQLPIPKFQPQPGDYYRKRKLYVNNFGIYCCNNAKMNCYLWSKYDGQKTADEII
jgi:hypothetical protein